MAKTFLRIVKYSTLVFILLLLAGCTTPDGWKNVALRLLEPVADRAGLELEPEFSWELEINPGTQRVNPFFKLYVALEGEEFGPSVQTVQNRAFWDQKLLAGNDYHWKVEIWLNDQLAATSEDRAFSTQDFYTVDILVANQQGGLVRQEGGDWGDSIVIQANVDTPTRLWAQAEEDFAFDGWFQGQECLSSDNPFDYVPNQPGSSPRNEENDFSIEARFSKVECAITATASPTQGGNVRVDGGSWGAQQSTTVESGEQVLLEALAQEDFHFDGWYEDAQTGSRGQKVSEENPYAFVAQNDRILTASFLPDTYTIQVEASPAAQGKVRMNGGEWKGMEQLELQKGSAVEVRALANSLSTFEGWFEDGQLVSRDSSYSWSVERDRNLVARFSVIPPVPEPGMVKWQFSTGGNIYACPAIGNDGTIYFGSWDCNFYALNPDGTEKWHFATEGEITSSAAIGADGTLFFGSYEDGFYALNPDGTEKWSVGWPGGWNDCSPAIGADGTVYMGGGSNEDGYLFAFDPTNGAEKWKYDSGRIISGPAISADGSIYAGNKDTWFYGFTDAGAEKWASGIHFDGQVWSSPAIGSDGTIYVGDDGKVRAITQDGTVVSTGSWPFITGDSVESSPIIGSDGTIYVGSEDSFFYAINPDGTEKWSYETGSDIYSTAAIGKDGTIYVGSDDSNLYAFNPDGTVKWICPLDDCVESKLTIGDDGTIYAGTDSGTLYAIYGESGGLADTAWPKFHQNLKNTGRKALDD